jgi:nitrogen fixation protein NifU and related proteins
MTNITSYSKKVLEHFRSPHNIGTLKNASGVGEVGNIICGDVMYLYIKVEKNKKGQDFISDISFETYGCAAAIATSSAVTDLAKGKTIKDALKINKDSVIKALDGLPSIKIHCSLLSVDALSEAIYDFLKKEQKEIPKELLKIHAKNQKEIEFVEKRNPKWVNTQKHSK